MDDAEAQRPRSEPDLADRLCDAIKEMTATRTSRGYAVHWIALSEVAQHLGITGDCYGQRSGAL